MALRTQNVG